MHVPNFVLLAVPSTAETLSTRLNQLNHMSHPSLESLLSWNQLGVWLVFKYGILSKVENECYYFDHVAVFEVQYLYYNSELPVRVGLSGDAHVAAISTAIVHQL